LKIQGRFYQVKILITSCVFPPEPVVSAKTSFDIVQQLLKRNHSVSVLASFPARPAGKLFPGHQKKLFSKTLHITGFSLVYCFSIPSSNSSSMSRLLENFVFGISSSLALLFLPRPDLIYANTWPIFATGLICLVGFLRRVPYILSIQDVYPESYTSQKRASNKNIVVRVMRHIDTFISRRAAHIIVISQAFADIYIKDRGVPANKVSVIPNWFNVEEQADIIKEDCSSLRSTFGIPENAFLAGFGGNIGIAAGVETFVEAFQYTNGLYGLIAGEGSQLSTCQNLAIEIAPQHISFLTPWPAWQTMDFYRAADVLVLPTNGAQSLASVPSKLIRYMLSGRPVLATGLPGSELDRIISTSGCGWIVPPNSPKELAEKLHEIKNTSSEDLRSRGEAGRNYALENFASDICLPKVIRILEDALNGE
jgi:colanic acid biosynthesis glycosyl transferase WcaI